MKILSWNILASEWIKSSYYPNVDKKILFNRTNRFKQILKHILELDPDIMLLQEVMKLEYSKLFKKFTSKYYISDLDPINWGNHICESGNVSFFRKTKFKNIEHFPLKFGIYSICTYKNIKINICNIHLDDISLNKRLNQINTLKHGFENFKLCLIAGDFNQQYTANNRIYKIPHFTVHNKCSSYYIEKKMNIDNILSKGFIEVKNICPLYPNTIEEGLQYIGSDHLPIFIVLKIK